MMKATKTSVLVFLLLIPAINVHAWLWPDTGQTKCYNDTVEIACPTQGQPFYGQDAQYQGPTRSYTKLGEKGVVLPDSATQADSWVMTRDNVTGLVWEMKTVDGSIHNKDRKFTWCDTNPATNGGDQGTCGTGTGDAATDTETFIKTLNDARFSGFSDWRMPTIKELYSLNNSAMQTIDVAWFPNTSVPYWSSTTSCWCSAGAWHSLSSERDLHTKSWSHYVRAVRGGQSGAVDPLVDHGDGTVTDTTTGLMWQNATAPGTYTWQQALAYTEALDLAGHKDWRLPNRNELQSLVDYSRASPSIDPLLCWRTASSDYWSSTTNATDTSEAWFVYFLIGNFDVSSKFSSGYVRAVRGGQSGSLDHFEITSDTGAPIGNQSVGSMFNIKVMAKDAGGNMKMGWNGPVMLSSTSGPVYPIEVQIVNGQWNGNVIIFKPGFAVQLTAMGAGASGSSNSFSVTGGSISIGALQGSVRDPSTSLINGASVYISDTSYGTPIDQRTAVNGSFAFNSLACMRYYIWAEFDQSGTKYKSLAKQIDVSCGQVSTAYLTITLSGAAAKTPVLLVPGMMGSYWINPAIPTMPPWRPDWDSENLYLYDWNKKVGWGNLWDDLVKNHGYVPGVTIFAVPYDWRLDLDSTVNKYLRKWIELAKTRAGTDKVDIVAHSMGGVLTRAYIQGSDYANDINKLAMVGTPNHGSANAYYLYEGGDPMTADLATGGIISLPVYTLVLNSQVFGNPIKAMYPLYYLHVRNYLHQHVPAAKQLLPTYDLLIPVIGGVRGLQCEENSWLKDLNGSSRLSRLGKEDDTDPTKVKTKVFMGDNKDTILNIYSGLKFCVNPVYPDGAPVGPLTNKISDGDGTVLQTSSFLGSS
ncbi:MAG: DUF1566 domain-containing protein, partial [Syntrophales bacterium]|nr:DUF1566 domain-containing protein [Syntrophales bacterium]